jgi:hypothetical protein
MCSSAKVIAAMSIFFWNKWRKSPLPPRRSRPHRRRSRLELEQLEDRVVPSLTLLSHYTGLDSAGVGGGGEPPDTQGAAGPSSVVETVNQGIGIFTPKGAGTKVVSDTLPDFFFTKGGLPNGGSSFGQSDPFTIYDPQVQRFIVGEIDFDTSNTNGATNALLLAVSKNNNPTTLDTSSWYFSEVTTTESGVALQDYPGNPGWNADALVVTLASFDSGGGYVHTQVNAISMNALVSGAALNLNSNYFQTDISEVLPRPAEEADASPGAPMWMTASFNGGSFSGVANTIDVLKMTNVLSASPTFTTTTLNVNPYYMSVNGLNPDGTQTDTLADSRMLQSAVRNNLLVTTDEISNAAGNTDMSRWYAINVASGTPVIQQQGDVGGAPNVYTRYPGININAQGDIGMVFVQSAKLPGQFESMFVTGRTPSDPLGTMEAPVLVQQGTNNYVGKREGDMTRVSVDPNGSFWAFGQWANNEAPPNWGTAIGNFSLAVPISVVLTSAVEGTPLNNVPVAVFLDNSGAPLGRYTSTINWGDGTITAGTVVSSGTPGLFLILGSHTYAEEGNYTLSVSESNGTATLGPVSGIVTVADAPLNGFAQSLNGQTAGFVTNALVAVFTDTDPAPEAPGNYSATIIWNEGNGLTFTSTGTIAQLSGNTFIVRGSSPYTFPSGGLFTVQVVVRDVGGATVTINSVISVSHNPAIPPLVPQYSSDTGPINAQFVSLQDALTNLLAAERLFLFALAFGTTQEKEGAFGNLMNAFHAYESAIFAYDMKLPGA